MNLYNIKLQLRALELSYLCKLSHLGSVLPAVNILDHIYSIKKENDSVILSNGHAGLALYCVLEDRFGLGAKKLLHKHGIHPNRDLDDKIYCSTGSLGMGITIAVGAALAVKDRNVYCIISDGEATEGSVWESLRFIGDNNIKNFKLFVQINGYSAYQKIDQKKLENRILSFIDKDLVTFCYTSTTFPGSEKDPLFYHYKILDGKEYEIISKYIYAKGIQTITF